MNYDADQRLSGETPPLCGFCQEPVQDHERGPILGEPLHHECGLRLILGSVAHLERRCGCYVDGSTESDPPGMTLRQAAWAAIRLHKLREVRN